MSDQIGYAILGFRVECARNTGQSKKARARIKRSIKRDALAHGHTKVTYAQLWQSADFKLPTRADRIQSVNKRIGELAPIYGNLKA